MLHKNLCARGDPETHAFYARLRHEMQISFLSGEIQMKMNKQSHTFAKQVQVDLLAFSDVDLFQTVHLWVKEASHHVSEEVYSALGYMLKESQPPFHPQSHLLRSETQVEMLWLAPSPQRLRERLTEMDMRLFMQYVLPLAYQSLHGLHPEWGEGATFNAHLANHLRRRVAARPGNPGSRLGNRAC